MTSARRSKLYFQHPALTAFSAFVLVMASTGAAHAQAKSLTGGPVLAPAPAQERSDSMAERNFRPTLESTKVFYLKNVTQQNDANEVLIALRNMLPATAKIYLAASQNTIVISAPPEAIQISEMLIAALDRPKKKYRLTFTTVETDAGKRVGVQHYALVATEGQRAVIKQGSRVPVVTGTYQPNENKQAQMMQYIDIGMNFDITLTSSGNGVVMRSKVEQSSIADDKTSPAIQDPVVRQSVTESTSDLALGKPTTIAAIDITGTTRHLDIEVVPELIQ